MSAWYILNPWEFTPYVQAMSDIPSDGLPFDKVEIELEDGKVFTVTAENRSADNPYVQEVRLNGEKLTEPFIEHADIEAGSTLSFVMGPEKNCFLEIKNWRNSSSD